MAALGIRTLLAVAAAATGIKLLLVPTYHSTDLEVHRNWLAITHSLPFAQWYTEATSEWTLDYPPFFAWFEFALSHVAKFVDPNMLVIQNLDYASSYTLLFLRLTVMATDAVYLSAAWALARHVSGQRTRLHGLVLLLLLAFNAGLLLVDHIHFQYNGVLVGLLLWSVYFMMVGRGWMAGVAYAVLIHMKHLYAYCAPLYLVQIARAWCRGGMGGVGRFLIMGLTVAGISGVSLGPFIHAGQLPQLVSRLFPFGRGLTHSYWAGNAWALYSAADKVLAATVPHLNRDLEPGAFATSSGLVGVSQFQVLPQVPPHVSLALVGLAMLPPTLSLLRRPSPGRFPAAVAYALLTGFWLGYHVHEKAILSALLPLAIPAVMHRGAAQDFLVLSAAGHYGLLPLLFQPQEYIIKVLLCLLYWLLAAHGLAALHHPSTIEGEASEQVEAEGYVSPSRHSSPTLQSTHTRASHPSHRGQGYRVSGGGAGEGVPVAVFYGSQSGAGPPNLDSDSPKQFGAQGSAMNSPSYGAAGGMGSSYQVHPSFAAPGASLAHRASCAGDSRGPTFAAPPPYRRSGLGGAPRRNSLVETSSMETSLTGQPTPRGKSCFAPSQSVLHVQRAFSTGGWDNPSQLSPAQMQGGESSLGLPPAEFTPVPVTSALGPPPPAMYAKPQGWAGGAAGVGGPRPLGFLVPPTAHPPVSMWAQRPYTASQGLSVGVQPPDSSHAPYGGLPSPNVAVTASQMSGESHSSRGLPPPAPALHSGWPKTAGPGVGPPPPPYPAPGAGYAGGAPSWQAAGSAQQDTVGWGGASRYVTPPSGLTHRGPPPPPAAPYPPPSAPAPVWSEGPLAHSGSSADEYLYHFGGAGGSNGGAMPAYPHIPPTSSSAHTESWSLSWILGAGPLLPTLPALYCLGFVPLELYCSFLHGLVLPDRLPFLPLLLTSTYCALGMGWVWTRMTAGYLLGWGHCGA